MLRLTGAISVLSPDLGEFCLLPQHLRVVGTVLDGVGLKQNIVFFNIETKNP
jgi:hypothetical protein